MITNDDPTEAGRFLRPTPETIARFDDEQLERAADRAGGERADRWWRFALLRRTAVAAGVASCVAVPSALGILPSITGSLALTIATVALLLVFAASVMVMATKRREYNSWAAAETGILAEIHRRRRGAR